MPAPDINRILENDPVPCKYGAPLGAQSCVDVDNPDIRVQRIKFVDGDYAPDGTYWGGPPSEPLFCGFNETNRIYVRAESQVVAILKILEEYPEMRIIELQQR